MALVLFGRADAPDIYYRVRWNSDAHVLYVEGEHRVLHVPGFEYARAKKEVLGDIRVEKLTSTEDVLKEVAEARIPKDFPYALAQYLPAAPETIREPFPERRVKDADELAAIEQAQLASAEAIAHVQRRLEEATVRDGVAFADGEPLTAEGLKAEARSLLTRRGYDCPELIISSGEQTAMPHHRGSGPIREGPVIIDIFPRSERSRYHGDMTRTVIVGRSSAAERMLAAVQQAHDAVVPLCVPGARCGDLHAHAEEVLAQHGFSTDEDAGFIHSLGHGIGLDVHEPPTLNPKSEDVLAEGMVVAIEPGLYYSIGVRYENLVVVGSNPTLFDTP